MSYLAAGMARASTSKLAWLAGLVLGCWAGLSGCASTRTVMLRPEPRALVGDVPSSAPNRPAFDSVTLVRPSGAASADPTLRDIEAALVSSGVRVIAPGERAKGSAAQAVLQLEHFEWMADRRLFVLFDSSATDFTPASEQDYRAAKPRSRWIVEALVLRCEGKLIDAGNGQVVDVFRIEVGSAPSAPLSFTANRGGVIPEQHGTGVSSFALAQHRQWLGVQVAKALVKHITLR